jgi:predicted phage terminase large subunit-like protein
LRYYELEDLPSYMPCVIAIDPVPPPSASEMQKGFKDKDYEALAVVGYHDNNYYLLDYKLNRGHAPDWTIAMVFQLAARWKPLRITVEGTAYQKTLAWLLEQAMVRQRKMIAVEQVTDKRKKEARIVDAITGPASHGRFLVRREHSEFISQFLAYSKVKSIPHDDLLDAIAMALHSLTNFEYLGDEDWYKEEEDKVEALEFYGSP